MPASALMMSCVLTGLGLGAVFGSAEARVVVAMSASRLGVKCISGGLCVSVILGEDEVCLARLKDQIEWQFFSSA